MLTIGLTGGIACGKSTVARILSEAGIPVLDLDQLARVVVAPQSEGLAEIAARWPHVVREGVLDRKALGAVIMADPTAKKELEAITHPRIWMQMEAWLAAQLPLSEKERVADVVIRNDGSPHDLVAATWLAWGQLGLMRPV